VPKIREASKNVYFLDDELYGVSGAGAVYFLDEDKKTLVDTGPATSIKVIIEGIRKIGYKPADIDYIVITHIHLDHSGGVGTLLKETPKAKVVVHPRGIKHLVDPSRLVSSSIEVQGKEILVKAGEVLPVDETRIIPAHDGDTFKLSNEQSLTLLETPGHASHELCILESRNRGLFVGDAVGHFIEGTDIMVPVTPPPSFDLELFLKSLARLKQINASRIYFPHAGISSQVDEKLDLSAKKLQERDNFIAKAAAENKIDCAQDLLTEYICAELGIIKQNMKPVFDSWAAGDIPMSAFEHVNYYRKMHQLC
jgi:glyoxylase-like metal-dependent hydrolase (beta-lactamase superfamily II)